MADLTFNKPQTDHEEDITQEISDEGLYFLGILMNKCPIYLLS